MEIKTVILPLDGDGIADPIESKLVNEHLRTLRKENYFSSNHAIIMGSRPNIIAGSDGKIYARQDCEFESLVMAQVTN